MNERWASWIDSLLQVEHEPHRRLSGSASRSWTCRAAPAAAPPRAKTSSLGIGTPTIAPSTGPPSRCTRRPIGRDALDPPAAGLGQPQQAHGLAGWRGVDHDQVVLALVDVVADPEQVAQLVHARQDGHLLGHHLVQAAPGEELEK